MMAKGNYVERFKKCFSADDMVVDCDVVRASTGAHGARPTYDSQRDRLVLFGGRNGEVLFADTWEFDGSDWKPTFMAGPSLRSGGPAVYDSARSVTVLYGGFRPLAALGDTWEWNGEQW